MKGGNLLETHLRHAIIEVISNGLTINGMGSVVILCPSPTWLFLFFDLRSCKICQMISQHAILPVYKEATAYYNNKLYFEILVICPFIA